MSDPGVIVEGAGPAYRHTSQEDHQILRTVAALLQEHHEKFGSDAKLANSIAGILAEALQLASLKDNGRLARALAPAVVGTVRTEIWNSKEEMVQALYPLAGQLVSAYVAESIAGLLNKTDEGLRSVFSIPRISLRLRSLMTGVPYRTLRLAYQFGVRLEAVLIVQRGGGIVLDEWEAANRRDKGKKHGTNMVAGMLAAVNEFAAEALASEGGALRTLDLGGSHVHVRATPAFIAAVKCSGRNSRVLDNYVDSVLREVLGSKLRSPKAPSLPGTANEAYAGVAVALARQLEAKLLDPSIMLGPGPRRPVAAYMFLGLLALLGIGALGNMAVSRVKASQMTQRVMDVVAADKAVVPSQIQATVLDGGRAVVLSGVVPSKQAAENLTQNVRDALGDVVVTQQFLYAVPENDLSSTVSQVNNLVTRVEALQYQVLHNVFAIGTDVTSRLLDTVQAPIAVLEAEVNQLKLLPVNLALPAALRSQEQLIASTLSGLANFQDPNAKKLEALSKLEFPVQQGLSTVSGGGPVPAGLMALRLPVSVTDEGVKVNLLSASGNYGAPLSLDSLGLAHGGVLQGIGGTAGPVTGELQTLTSATASTASSLTAATTGVASSLTATTTGVGSSLTGTTTGAASSLTGTAGTAVTDTVQTLSGTASKLLSPKH